MTVIIIIITVIIIVPVVLIVIHAVAISLKRSRRGPISLKRTRRGSDSKATSQERLGKWAIPIPLWFPHGGPWMGQTFPGRSATALFAQTWMTSFTCI